MRERDELQGDIYNPRLGDLEGDDSRHRVIGEQQVAESVLDAPPDNRLAERARVEVDPSVADFRRR